MVGGLFEGGGRIGTNADDMPCQGIKSPTNQNSRKKKGKNLDKSRMKICTVQGWEGNYVYHCYC